MNENGEVEAEVEVEEPTTTTDAFGGLEARMRRRAQQVQNKYTEIFPLPRYEDILGVELRLMGWQALRKIGKRHERVRDEALQELYVAADTVLAATEGFHEFDANGAAQARLTSWQQLAAGVVQDLPEDVTARQALIALVGDTNVVFLWNDYQEWLRNVRPDAEEEVGADFRRTTSPS